MMNSKKKWSALLLLEALDEDALKQEHKIPNLPVEPENHEPLSKK